MVEVLRSCEVTHCGAQYLYSLPWGEYVMAVSEAAKISKERNGG